MVLFFICHKLVSRKRKMAVVVCRDEKKAVGGRR